MLVQIFKPDLASVASKRLEELKSKKQELLEMLNIELYQEYLKMFKLERLCGVFFSIQ